MLELVKEIVLGSATTGGGVTINNEDITITENGEYTAGEGYTGLGTVTVNVSDIPAVIETLNVTPSTSAQTITPSEGVDGFNPVNVSAVTSSIDANIQASNIKSGVTILSVTGTLDAAQSITATNNSSSAVTSGDKVWVEPVSQNYTFTSASGENAITTSPFRFTSTGTSGSLNALISNNTTSIGSSSVEVQIKYKINRAPENYLFLASIFGKSSQGLDYQNGSYNGMTYRITTNNTATWSISNWNQYGASNISSKVGNWIWDKFTLTANSSSSTTFLTQNSTDGINWTNGSSFTSSFNLFDNLFENLVRFGINTTIGSEFVYELDLDETYVKVDGQIVWKAQTGGGYKIKDFSSVTSSFFTGTARENIAINASGSVTVGFNKSKYGATIDNFLCDVDANGKMLAPLQPMDLVFTGVKKIDTTKAVFPQAASKEYYPINSVSFPDLEEINVSYGSQFWGRGFSKLFYNTLVRQVSFSKLKKIEGAYAFQTAFYTDLIQANDLDSGLKNVEFTELEEINSSYGMNASFYGNKNLETCLFPKLKKVNTRWSNGSTFGNTKITTQNYPALEEISGEFHLCDYCETLITVNFTVLVTLQSQAFNGAFRNCSALTDIYYNALTSASFGNSTNQFQNMFNSTSMSTSGNCTIHFPSSLQSKIESLTGYPNFGATTGRLTLAFDLPATE